jgi:hypothetical protein
MWNDSPQNTRDQFEIVAARATRADLPYLARRFLASLHERANRASDAAQEYELRAVAPVVTLEVYGAGEGEISTSWLHSVSNRNMGLA